MAAFTILEPSVPRHGAGEPADQIIFLREKFSLAAFLFGPLWMMWQRLWVVLIAYLAVVGLAGYALQAIGVGWLAMVCIFWFLQLLVGLEATSLRHWARLRSGWNDCGVVIADDLEMAERRFFDSRAVAWPAPDPAKIPVQLSAAPTASSRLDIVGLFPEPGGGR